MDNRTTPAYRAEPCSSDLFSDHFPGAQLRVTEADTKYVSDFLDQDYLDAFFRQHRQEEKRELDAMFLVAQTGRGKNYWVIHELRYYAVRHNLKILYLCNRVALSVQQIADAAKAVNPIYGSEIKRNLDEYETGSITLMTYHKYYGLVRKYGEKFFCEYDLCVADEAHFFCSDCLFNPDTEAIMKSLPKVFRGKFRIYMTATPEYVYDPIYWTEWNAIKAGRLAPEKCKALMIVGKGEVEDTLMSLPVMPVFRFQYDYSPYRKQHFFSDESHLLKEIKEDKSDFKWIIFISSKKKGKEMQEYLEQAKITAWYVDRESRSSANREVRNRWDYLQEVGDLGEAKVLLTTSVLDNGFSIKDKKVKNIVLFTDDRVEFLQELGRVRLMPKQEVRIYMSVLDEMGRLHPSRRREILDAFALYYGNKAIKEYSPMEAEIVESPVKALHYAKTNNLGFIGSKEVMTEVGEVEKPYINNLARYITLLMKKEAELFEQMLMEYGTAAVVKYKQRWLEGLGFVEYTDIDKPEGKRVAAKVIEFMTPYRKVILDEDDETFLEFSEGVKKLVLEIKPDYTGMNKSRTMKRLAINNVLKALSVQWAEVPKYELVKNTEGLLELVCHELPQVTNEITSAESTC